MPIYRKSEGQFAQQGLVDRAIEEQRARSSYGYKETNDADVSTEHESNLLGQRSSRKKDSVEDLERKARAGSPTPVSGDAMRRGREHTGMTQHVAGVFGSGVMKGSGKMVKGDFGPHRRNS